MLYKKLECDIIGDIVILKIENLHKFTLISAYFISRINLPEGETIINVLFHKKNVTFATLADIQRIRCGKVVTKVTKSPLFLVLKF